MITKPITIKKKSTLLLNQQEQIGVIMDLDKVGMIWVIYTSQEGIFQVFLALTQKLILSHVLIYQEYVRQEV